MKHQAHKSESPAATGQFADKTTHTADSAIDPRQHKAESTLIATLALAGHAVHLGRCNDYTVCKYGYSFYAQDLDALKAFAVRLGVCHE